jgi:hypothetical protein
MKNFFRRLIAAARPRLLTILVLAVAISVLWPLYRKFVIDEWHERVLAQQPVVFTVDCPSLSDHLKCNDRYTIVARKTQDGQWCLSVTKNNDSDTTPQACGINPNARDFSKYWHYLEVDGQRVYYSWRGRVLIPGTGYVGWFATPEQISARAAHPLSIN